MSNSKLNKYSLLVFRSLLILFCIIFLENIIAITIAKLGFTLILNEFLSSVIFCPIIEEYSKKYAIDNGFPYTFLFIFIFVETFIYVGYLLLIGRNIGYAFYCRIYPALMHFICMKIQLYNNDRGRWKYGYFMSTLLHSFWNFIVT